MKLDKVLVDQKLARSRAEAQRLIKQGAVSVGGCAADCTFFKTGNCTCGGWEKTTDTQDDIPSGWCVKIGKGFWRRVPKLEGEGFDQLNGVCKVPYI